tara:strand:- start:472 stop:939 length:468 start_codon:yes stop_codon:yes gene_type:complete
MSNEKTIVLSGGFDPIHAGHIKMIQAATLYGEVTIVLNSDDWLKRKKGYVFMPFTSRSYLLRHIKGVKEVFAVDDSDNTVCEALRRINPDMFGNGGNRTAENTPEVNLCKEMKIDMVWNLGGNKIQSSRGLINTLFASKPVKSEMADFKRLLDDM